MLRGDHRFTVHAQARMAERRILTAYDPDPTEWIDLKRRRSR